MATFTALRLAYHIESTPELASIAWKPLGKVSAPSPELALRLAQAFYPLVPKGLIAVQPALKRVR